MFISWREEAVKVQWVKGSKMQQDERRYMESRRRWEGTCKEEAKTGARLSQLSRHHAFYHTLFQLILKSSMPS